MPIYEYECKECKERFEVLHHRSDEVLNVRCPKCQGDKLQSILSFFSSEPSEPPDAGCSPSGTT